MQAFVRALGRGIAACFMTWLATAAALFAWVSVGGDHGWDEGTVRMRIALSHLDVTAVMSLLAGAMFAAGAGSILGGKSQLRWAAGAALSIGWTLGIVGISYVAGQSPPRAGAIVLAAFGAVSLVVGLVCTVLALRAAAREGRISGAPPP